MSSRRRRAPTAPNADPLLPLSLGASPPLGTPIFAKNELGLYLPAHLLGRGMDPRQGNIEERPAMLRFLVTTVGWHDITGSRAATINDVVERLRCFSLQQILLMGGWLTLALSSQAPREDVTRPLAGQVRILRKFLGEEDARRAVEKVRQLYPTEFDSDQIVFFHERQILNAIKLAFLALDHDAAPRKASALPFCQALLMLNDLLDAGLEELDQTTDEGRSQMELYLAANVLFNQSSHLLHDVVRAHYLFVEPHLGVGGSGAVDVPAALERATGMKAETVWRALFALQAFWLRAREDLGSGRVFQSRSRYLSALTGLNDEERDRWMRLAVADASDLQREIRDRYSLANPRYFDILPFERRPLVAFGDEVFCTSIPLLLRLPAGSLQHRLMDTATFNRAETRAFLDTRGHLVERYTEESFTRAFGNRFVAEQTLQNLSAGHRVCDGVIIYPDAAILVECKTSSPNLDTRHGANYAAYRQKWRANMRKAADQFVSTLQLLRGGAFEKIGISRALREIYPVVCVFEQPVTPLTCRAIVERDLRGHELLARADRHEVAPIQLLSIKEVEMWELAAERGRSIRDLLKEKTEDAQMTELSFHDFIHRRGEQFQHGHGSWYAERFQAISGAAREFYRSLGMP